MFSLDIKENTCTANIYILIVGCPSRFTHANRHCSEHPYATLVRIKIEGSIKDLILLREQESNNAVREWLDM